MMAKIEIDLPESDNPEYYGLFKEKNGLIDRWNVIMEELQAFKVSKFYPWKDKKRIVKIWPRISELQEDFLEWSGKAQKFCLNPDLFFPTGTRGDLGFLHFPAALRDVRNLMDFYMVLLINGYNLRAAEIDHREDYLIAMTGLVLSLIGLWFSLSSIDF